MITTPFLLIGIDGGGSHTTCRILDESRLCRGRSSTGPSNFRKIGLKAALGELARAVDEAWIQAAVQSFPVAALGLGMAGVDRPEDKDLILKELRLLSDCRLGKILNSLSNDKILMVNDAEAALVGGLGKREGVVAVSGTGSIVWGCNNRGEVGRAGGWGHFLGDPGSAFAIGRRGIQEAFRAFDGLMPPTTLQKRLIRHYQLTQYKQFLNLAYDDDFTPSDWASFAVEVDEAALEGDKIARKIIFNAAEDLAEMAIPVVKSLFFPGETCELATTGGVWANKCGFRECFKSKMQSVFPDISIKEPLHDAAWGACILAGSLTNHPQESPPPLSAGFTKAKLRSSI